MMQAKIYKTVFSNLACMLDFLIQDKKSVLLYSSALVSNFVSSSTGILDIFGIFIDLLKSLSLMNQD